MEQLGNGFTLDTAEGTFPLSTDSMLLSGFVKLPKNARVLDLGSGCGTLGLLLCAADDNCHVTGIELDEKAHRTALENIRRNGLESRLCSICGDLRTLAPDTYHCCVSNPPYFPGGPASKATPLAGGKTAAGRRNCLPQQPERCALAVIFIWCIVRNGWHNYAPAPLPPGWSPSG